MNENQSNPDSELPDLDTISRLVPMAKAGSDDARDELLNHVQQYVALMAKQKMTPNLQGKFGASDIAQVSMAQALVGFEKFRGKSTGEFYAWLKAIVQNVARGMERDFRRRKRDIGRERALASERSGSALGFIVLDDEQTPRSHAIAAERVERLHQALAKLPDDYAEVIRLRSLEQLTLNEVADRMGRSFDSVRKLWYRAMLQLKQELQPDLGD